MKLLLLTRKELVKNKANILSPFLPWPNIGSICLSSDDFYSTEN